MLSETVEKTEIKRGPGGRFLPGQSPYSAGRPSGTRNVLGLLNDALKAVEQHRAKLDEPCSCVLDALAAASPKDQPAILKRACKTLDQHFANRAMMSDTVLIAFQKKRIPDLQHQTGDTPPTQINILLGHRKLQIVQPELANA